MTAQRRMGAILESRRRFTDALSAYAGATERQKARIACAPADQSLKVELVAVEDRTGDLLFREGRFDECLGIRKDVLAQSIALASAAPFDQSRPDDLAVSHVRVGLTLQKLKRVDEAIAELREALRIRQALLSIRPSSKRWQDADFAWNRRRPAGRTTPEPGRAASGARHLIR